MARQPGARTQVAFAFESVYGTPPASGYRRMPFATTTLGSEQGLLSRELLGYGRDPQAPIRDAVNVDGDVVIPMDAENLGFWLKAIFDQPVTTGITPRTHTFQSGGFTLPSMAIETQMPDVPRFAMYSGLVADRIQWQSQRSGLLTATVGLIGRGETVAATTAAGTLALRHDVPPFKKQAADLVGRRPDHARTSPRVGAPTPRLGTLSAGVTCSPP